VTIKNGRRVSSYEAFLKPVRNRPNLTIATETLVERIVIEAGRAVGVDVQDRAGTHRVGATREVILSAGTIGSPKILQLSGIGPAKHLSDLGIPPKVDRPAVGANLSEHKAIWQEYRLKRHMGHNLQLRGWRFGVNALRYLLLKSGPLATSVDINGFIRTTPDLDRPDAQISFWSLTAKKDAARLETEPFPAVNAGGWHLRPKSRGSVMLRSPDPRDPPVIRPNFLAHSYDRRVLIGTFRYLRKVFRHPGLAALIAEETLPGPGVETDEEIIAACGGGENGYHATGTCRMGSDADAVVDPELRVRGLEGLRVIDCSVMPTQVSAGVNGPVMALAWHAASLLCRKNQS
jgi:choline dehydrogenase